MPERDPVARELGDSEDLYDVATWDVRSGLDRAAVRIHGGLVRARRYTLILVALGLFLVQLAAAGVLVLRRPSIGVLAALSAIPAVALVAFVWYRDPTMREPFLPLAATFVLAVLFASFAALINGLLSAPFGLVPVVGLPLFFLLVVGPIEETVKLLAVRVFAYRQPSFDAVIDGAVYGAVAGLGFATIENLVYIARAQTAAAGTGMEPFAATATALSRAFVGPGHVLYSSLAGYYLGLAKFNPGKRGPIVVKGLTLAALIHAFYNTTVSSVSFGAFGVPPAAGQFGFILLFDGVVAYFLYRKLSRYGRYHDRANETRERRRRAVEGPVAGPPAAETGADGRASEEGATPVEFDPPTGREE